MPPLKKAGHIALHISVGMSVSLNLVQLITQECFSLEASNLVGRYSLMSKMTPIDIEVKGHASLLHLVQLITQERFAPKSSNMVGS